MSRFLTRKSTAKTYEIEDDDVFVENPMGMVAIAHSRPTELKPLPEEGVFVTYASAPLVAPTKAVYIPHSDDLPEGWTWTKDSKGRVYYVNLHTGATQWGRPGLEDVERAQQEAQMRAEMQKLESEVVKNTLAKQAQKASQAPQSVSVGAGATVSNPNTRASTISSGMTQRARPKAFTLLQTQGKGTMTPNSLEKGNIFSPPAITEVGEDNDAPPPPPGSHISNHISPHQQVPAPPPSPPANSTPAPAPPTLIALDLAPPSSPPATSPSPSPSVGATSPALGASKRSSSKFGNLFAQAREASASNATPSSTPLVKSVSTSTIIPPQGITPSTPSGPVSYRTFNGTQLNPNTATMKPLSLAEIQRQRQAAAGSSSASPSTLAKSTSFSTSTPPPALAMPAQSPPTATTPKQPPPADITPTLPPPPTTIDTNESALPPPPTSYNEFSEVALPPPTTPKANNQVRPVFFMEDDSDSDDEPPPHRHHPCRA